MGELGVDFTLCIERVGESRFNLLMLIERAGELRLELTLTFTQMRGRGGAFVLGLRVGGLDRCLGFSELTGERTVGGGRIGQLR